MALTWDKSLAVGVKFIDEQHQELFRQVNALLEAILKNQGKEEVGKLLAFLGKYTVEHFGAEEKVMFQYKYPDLIKHTKQHADFIAALSAAVHSAQRSSSGVMKPVFARVWRCSSTPSNRIVR